MKNKTTLYNFILDRSGSMSGMETVAVQGFNDHLKTIRNLQKEFHSQQFLCSLTTFDNQIETVVESSPIDQISPIEVGQYSPRGMTALLDAIGKNIHDVNEKYKQLIESDEMSVVFVIITDGHENASQFFSYHDIAQKIASLENSKKWTFTFIGADFDAIHTSQMLNIKIENTMNINKSDYRFMSDEINEQMHSYSASKERGVIKNSFFSKK
jgi:uncharacterized protein YegL